MGLPGDSSVPASIPPIITASAPAANALAASPGALIPPSAIVWIPKESAAEAHCSIAVICGTPTPATTRVEQTLPGPIPTLTTSAPALAKSSTAR